MSRRAVTLSPGHTINVRRIKQPASRAGYVCVRTTDRIFEIEQARWDAAPPAASRS